MALIPPQYLNAVVSIELESEVVKNDGTKVKESRSVATGFLYGKLKDRNGDTRIYSSYLVTNRHVFQNPQTKEYVKQVLLRFNLSEKKGKMYAPVELLNSSNQPIWLSHKNEKVDLAVLPINISELTKNNVDFYFFRDDQDVFLSKKFEEIGVSTGDGVFVLGFPLGISGATRNFSIVKSGIIARYDEELLNEHYFFVDSTAYPGNSGGPVIFRPEVVSIQGTLAVSRAALLGVISQGISYQEVAVSRQTGRDRIMFEEQTGIVKVVPMDSVNETIEQYEIEKGVPKGEERVEDEK